MALAGQVVAERFRLVRELGQGGMGSVWLAHDTSLDTPCAIKFVHDEAAQSAEARERFKLEARAAAQLRSPNVVQILDYGVSGGMPYIAMEYLEGEDLGQRISRLGRLGPAETVAIASQVAKALTRANAAGLVHRDLKPANIFLVRDEDRDLAKVLDFGVAKQNLPGVDAHTRTGALVGTPYYMSPEQARGTRRVDHRSDLWALAVIVFQCVTGRLPFVSDALGDLLFRIAGDPLPVPSGLAPHLPPSFDAWWIRAAARDPAQRYQTARELVDALALSLGVAPSGELAASAPGHDGGSRPQTPGASRSSSPKPRRGRAGLLAVAAAVVVLGGTLVYALALRRPPTPRAMVSEPPVTASTVIEAPPSATATPSQATAAPNVSVASPSVSAQLPVQGKSGPGGGAKGIRPPPPSMGVRPPPPPSPPTPAVPDYGI